MTTDSWKILEACDIADRFALATGVEGEAPPRRYLWTDAFAVCLCLGLHRLTGRAQYGELAYRLVDQVHHVLGRHRPDDPRTGWISGLSEAEGERHPTAGGLRIGKTLPERPAGDPYDPRAEWDRDGQYYHYLTKWMLALHAVHRASGSPWFHRWAVELAAAAQTAFRHPVGGSGDAILFWKMSIDLSRPLVDSAGGFDPVDGFVVLNTLEHGTRGAPDDAPGLEDPIDELWRMCSGGRWATADPLGIGGILTAAYRLGALLAHDDTLQPRRRGEIESLEAALLEQAVPSLAAFDRSGTLEGPALARLPFRELGLAIGMLAIGRLAAERSEERADDHPASRHLAWLTAHRDTADRIVDYWIDPTHRGATWYDHADINDVMLATALTPDGFLALDGSDAERRGGHA